MFRVSDGWQAEFPDAHAGVIIMRDVSNPSHLAELEKRKDAVEDKLRARLAGADRTALANDPVLRAYQVYYKRFKKTYHVQLQIESVAFKGKSIPSVAALVEAMFIAELEDGMLTAGHDLEAVHLPITLDVSKGSEEYMLLRGVNQVLKAGDMMMVDGEGVISSILYGPDARTAISPETRNVLFATYAPSGISNEAVQAHLENIKENVLLIAPDARIELLQVLAS